MLALQPKSQGRGLMVSDFIDEHSGFLRLSSEEQQLARLSQPNLSDTARVIFKFGAQGDGYWNSEHFIAQVDKAMKIAEFKYPSTDNILLFLCDQSSGHCAYSDDALISNKIGLRLLCSKFYLLFFPEFPKNLPIILLIIIYYSHKILLTILHAGNSGVR